MQNKIAIVTSHTETIRWENYGHCDFCDLAHQNHLDYANKHGYEIIRKIVNQDDYADWHPTWIKIHVLLDYIQKYDYVVWIDSDAVFVNQDIKIEELIEDNIDLVISKMAPDLKSQRVWTKTSTGFLVLKNSEWTINLLNSLLLNPGDHRFNNFHEQSRLDEELSKIMQGNEECDKILNRSFEDIEYPIKVENIKVLPYAYHMCEEVESYKYIYHAGGSTPTKLQRIKKSIHTNTKMNIALTITSSKRFDLLNDTINTFFKYCVDSDKITEIILFDDSSDDVDRFRMYSLLYKKFKKSIKFVFFDKDSFNDKRHRNIINIWKKEIKNFDYVFHLEDDWNCLSNFSILKTIEVLNKNPEVAYCGFSKESPEWVPENLNGLKIIDNEYWLWPYNPEVTTDFWFSPSGSGRKLYNWPNFSLTPGLHDVKKLNELGEIPDVLNFEYAFGVEYSKKFKTMYHVDNIFSHTGGGNSAYDLNKSLR